MPAYITSTPSETLTAATPKTVLSIVAGATRRTRVVRMQLGGSSVTATDAAVLIEIIRTNQAGAGTSTGVTPTLVDALESAAISTSGRTYTAEPTTVSVIDNLRLSPIGNTYLWELPPGRVLFQAVSTTFGLRLTSPATQTTNFASSFMFEE